MKSVNTFTINDRLADWRDQEGAEPWSGLLVGNGASRAIWDEFKYNSLFEKASSDIRHPLGKEDKEIFKALSTTNFEQVLSALWLSQLICHNLKIDRGPIVDRYKSIKRSLVEAVHAVHVPWSLIETQESKRVLKYVRDELLKFSFVYSTNYDLINYWAVMVDGGRGFKDYFWSVEFNISNTEIWDKCTKILYLHGGLHLYKNSFGGTFKRSATDTSSLLDLFGIPFNGAEPLFITEGSSGEKLNSIHGSGYLAFAFSQFHAHQGPLVVFGHSLGSSDFHLVEAMRSWGNRSIAISIYPQESSYIIETKTKMAKLLPRAKLIFYDATTHPLGSPDLRVSPIGWKVDI